MFFNLKKEDRQNVSGTDVFLWQRSGTVQLLLHPKDPAHRPLLQERIHGGQGAVWADAGPHGPVRPKRLVGQRGPGLYLLHAGGCPGCGKDKTVRQS